MAEPEGSIIRLEKESGRGWSGNKIVMHAVDNKGNHGKSSVVDDTPSSVASASAEASRDALSKNK